MVMAFSLVTFTGCKSYQDDIDQLNADIVSLKNSISTDYGAKITALTTDVNTLKTQLQTLQTNGATKAELDAVKADILSKTVSLTALEAYKKTAQDALDALAKKTGDKDAELLAEIVKVKTASDALGVRVDALEKKVAGITSFDPSVLQGKIDAINATLDAVLKIKDGKSTVLTDIQSQLDDQLKRIVANETAIKEIQDKLKTVVTTTQLDAAIKDFKALQSKLDIVFEMFNTRLTSLTYIPYFHVNGIPAIDLSKIEACVEIAPVDTFVCHMNPSFVKLKDIDADNVVFSVIASSNLMTNGYSAPQAANTIKAKVIKVEGGKIYAVAADPKELMALSENNMDYYLEKFNMIALQVPLNDSVAKADNVDPSDRTITSEYVRVHGGVLTPALSVNKPTVTGTYPYVLPTTLAGAKALTVEGVDGATSTDITVVTLPYGVGNSINLIDSIVAVDQNFAKFVTAKYGLKFKFDLKDSNGTTIVYNRGTNGTDQQMFINLTDATKGTIKAKVFGAAETEIYASQGRTPIVHVVMYSADCAKVYEAFIKVVFANKAPAAPKTLPTLPLTGKFACSGATAVVNVEKMNTVVYNGAEMSKTQFHAAYSNVLKTTLKDGEGNFVGTAEYAIDPQATDSYIINYTLAPGVLEDYLKDNNSYTFNDVIVFTPMSSTDPIIKLPITVTITKPGIIKIKEVWNSAFTETVRNALVPINGLTVKYVDPARTPLTATGPMSNIYQLQNVTTQSILPAPFVGPEQYYFTYTLIGGQKVNITLAGGEKLIVADDNTLTYQGETIATINGVYVTPNLSSDKAKALLNKEKQYLKVNLGLRAVMCDGTFNLDKFTAIFNRPISSTPNATNEFINGVNVVAGQLNDKGSYLSIEEMINLKDWRQDDAILTNRFIKMVGDPSVNEHEYYYAYYGVVKNNITVDIPNATTTYGNGGKLNLYPISLYVESIGGKNYLRYKNDGAVVNADFTITVPVTVPYTWGTLKENITIPVRKTIIAGVKRK